jgi:hypothetical protein
LLQRQEVKKDAQAGKVLGLINSIHQVVFKIRLEPNNFPPASDLSKTPIKKNKKDIFKKPGFSVF